MRRTTIAAIVLTGITVTTGAWLQITEWLRRTQSEPVNGHHEQAFSAGNRVS